jgi:predicted nucleic acid-binding protein
MQEPGRYTVVFDASVLVPGFLSNLLLWLAQTDLFQARWSSDIHTQWIRARKKRYEIEVDVSEKRRIVMDQKFPQAIVTGYEELIPAMKNDAGDRHVLAAAVKCGADAIVTSNLKHFPSFELSKYN